MNSTPALGLVVAPVPLWAVVALSGVVGLVLGSFLNVVVYRVPRRISVVRPPSFCPRCRTPVRSVDNVPVVSWIVLGGRCRSCGEPISVRYPLVEAGTGLLFALVAVATGPHWAVAGLCAAGATALSATVVELDGMRPPPVMVIIGSSLSLLLLAGAAVTDELWAHLAGAGAGVLVVVAVSVAVDRWTPASGRALLRGAGWGLLPAGVVLGWAGPAGATAGIGVLGVLVLVLPAARRHSPDPGPGGVAAAGIASATALACVAAVAVALGVGPALGG